MNEAEAFRKLAELEEREIEIRKERKAIFLFLAHQGERGNIWDNIKVPEFKKKVDAYRYVLGKFPDGLHLDDLLKELNAIGVTGITKNNVSGVLRSYDMKKKYFKALGENRFKLREED